MTAKAHAQTLREQIADHEHRTFVLEHPSIDRRALDHLVDELRVLESEGEEPTADSPTRRDPAPARDAFASSTHATEWVELPVVASVAELKAFHAKVLSVDGADATYVASATMPGVDVLLTYTDGVLTKGVLRGDGHAGTDVTDNLRTLRSVPLRLRPPGTITESRATKLVKMALGPATLSPVPPFPDEIHIRAVVAMRATDLTALDRRRVDAGDPPYVLPTGAVLGSVRRLDPAVTATRALKVFATGVDVPPTGIDTAWQLLGALKSWGFSTLPVTWRCKGLQEVLDFVAALQQIAPSFEFPLEAAVLSVNRMGFGVRAADRAVPSSVRLTFPSPGRAAVAVKTYHAVGRGGALLPVVQLQRPPDHKLAVPERAPIPAEDGGTIAAVGKGVRVRVRPGSVAPIISLEGVGVAVAVPNACPACTAPLKSATDEPFVACPNHRCPGRVRARLLHLVGPRGLKLGSVKLDIIEKLQSEFDVFDLPSMLRLEPSRLDRIAPGEGTRFEDEVARTKELPLWRLLYLLAIPHVSERAARQIAHHVFEVARLESLTPDDCRRIVNLAPEAANGLAAWLASRAKDDLNRVREAGIQIVDGVASFPAPFLGQHVVVAGELTLGAVQVADEIERRGGTIQSAVGRRTDLLVVGERGEKYVDQAAMYGVPVVEEAGIRSILDAI